MPATICHIAIPSTDLKSSTEFYAKVFGWEIDWSIPVYPFWKTENVSGAFHLGLEPKLGVEIYLRVDDIEAKLAEIEAAGGSIIKGKEIIGEDESHGFDGHFSDPSGNELGLCSDR